MRHHIHLIELWFLQSLLPKELPRLQLFLTFRKLVILIYPRFPQQHHNQLLVDLPLLCYHLPPIKYFLLQSVADVLEDVAMV